MNGVGCSAPKGVSIRALKASLAALVMGLAMLFALGGTAEASPGSYRILLAEPYPQGPHTLGAQLGEFPEVAEIIYVDTNLFTPTAASLSIYDMVVSVGDSSYADSKAWGDSLAEYAAAGGVVVQTAYDNWDNVGGFGRFETEGYEPFLPGPNENEELVLGTYNSASPLMQGVTTLASTDNTEPELAPGATLVANWSNGANAVAVKGHVVSISAFIGDGYSPEEVWSGDYGRLIFNAVHSFDPIPPVIPPAPVVSPPPPPPSNLITLGKFKRNKKKGTATLSVTVPGAGSLVLSGKGIKTATLATTAAGTVNVPVKLVGKAKKTLVQNGKAKVAATATFTPNGGTAAATLKKLILKKTLP